MIECYLRERALGKTPFTWSNEQIRSHIYEYQKPWLALCVDEKVLALVLFIDLKNIIEITYLETHAEYLRRGFMGQLLAHLFSEWDQHGVWLDVHEDNVPGRKLYLSLGFKKTGLRKGYYRDGGACVQMSLEAKL